MWEDNLVILEPLKNYCFHFQINYESEMQNSLTIFMEVFFLCRAKKWG